MVFALGDRAPLVSRLRRHRLCWTYFLVVQQMRMREPPTWLFFASLCLRLVGDAQTADAIGLQKPEVLTGEQLEALVSRERSPLPDVARVECWSRTLPWFSMTVRRVSLFG